MVGAVMQKGKTMRLIDADALLTDENYEKYLKDILIEDETGEMYIRPKDVADLIAGTPTVIHLCKVCKYMNNPWYSETCDGCTGRECNFSPIDPVIRCKDCKHLYKDGECPLRTWFTHTENDFCSYGERKDNEID